MQMFANLVIYAVFQIGAWAQNCPMGYTLYDATNACYKATRTTPVTFDVAEADCESTGGMLSSITSAAESAHIQSLTAVGGGPYDLTEMTWIGMRYNGTWNYIDGATKTVGAVWGFGEPDNWYKNEYCVQMCQDVCKFGSLTLFFGNTQKLNDWPCESTSAAYVCKAPNTPNTCTSTISDSPCIDGYHYFSGTNSCFKVIKTDLPLSFSKAKSSCQIENAHLASITTTEESAFIKNLSSTGSPTELTQQPYIGLDNKGADIPWFDGNPKMAIKWADAKTMRSNCFVFVVDPALSSGTSLYSGATELVVDVDCAQESSRFICKTSACPFSSTTTVPTTTEAIAISTETTTTSTTTAAATHSGSYPCMKVSSPMTVIFAMDSSSSMKSSMWSKMVNFVKSAGQFLPASATIHFIKFSTKVTVSKLLKPGWTVENFESSVPKILDSGASNTPSAFNKAVTIATGDTNKNKVMLIITDGRPETKSMKLAEGRKRTKDAADLLKTVGIKLYAIGAGPDLYADGVAAIMTWLTDPSDFFWRNASATPFSDSHMNDVLTTICAKMD